MEKIWYFLSADDRQYRMLRDEIGPVLDDAGISFHIASPGEDIPGLILGESDEKEVRQ